PGSEFLTGGDLGLTPGLNQPRVTQRVEQVLADAFHAPAAALVQRARQQPQDSYVLADVLATLRAAGVPALTDDNYAVMKVA
ncbi:hypothetical protein UZZ22_24815, partial [Escherichia coli]|nr:hypothetical protein [Escherichia coli]